MKVLKLAGVAAIAYFSFLTGGFFESHLTWKPVQNGVWQKQILTWRGTVKITVDYSYGDPWLTMRMHCYGTPREEVHDFIVGSQTASKLDCEGKSSDVAPDPRWHKWFKDAPRPTHVIPAQPGLTQPIYNNRREPKSFGLV